jgi:hypothetical protein
MRKCSNVAGWLILRQLKRPKEAQLDSFFADQTRAYKVICHRTKSRKMAPENLDVAKLFG